MIQMPELVAMAKEALGGKYPKVLKALRGLAIGRFYPVGKGKITLQADIFKDMKQAAGTIAHELGHLIDYLPDHTLKRGNLLGRLATLKRHMKGTMPIGPNMPGELTQKDRRRLQAEAKKMLQAEHPDGLIDEEIRKELPISPDDVLAIWRVAGDAARKNEELYDFIAKMSTAMKKATVKAAMQGVIPEQLRRFSTWVTEKTGRKIKWEPTKELIKKKFEKLIEAELRKRKLLKDTEVREELKALSVAWKPFTPIPGDKYTKYRFSGVELYADTFSAIINAPGLVRAKAPLFYEAFFNYLERKPQIKSLYDQIQLDIRSGAVATKRVGRLRQMFKRGDEAYFEASKPKKDFKDNLMRELVDANHFLLKRIRQVGEKNIPAGENPRYSMEELKYSGSEHEWYLQETSRNVVKTLEDASLTWDDFGELLYHNRVVNERNEMANPQGWTPELSEGRVNEIMAWSPDKAAALEKARTEFRKIHDYVVEKVADTDMHGAELVKIMRDAEHYATFDVIDYIEQRYGKGPGGAIHRQIGTLNEISNPATATVMKDLSMIRAVNRHVAVKDVVKFMRGHFPDEVRLADARWVNNRWEIVDTKDAHEGMIPYLSRGKLRGVYVPKEIAELFEANPIEGMAIAKGLRALAKPFRAVFTELNYGFWMFNLYRDYWRAVANLPKTSALKFIPYYMRGIRPAYRSIFGVSDATIAAMQKNNMLISVASHRGMRSEDAQIERMLKRYGIAPTIWKYKVLQPFGKFFTYFTNIGRIIERTPKVAAHLYLSKKFPDLDAKTIGHIVRTQAGSPDFLRAGRGQPIYNNLLLFSNAMKEGYRGDYEALTKSPASFMYKRFKYTYMPKLLMYAATLGLLGTGIKQVMDGATEYDKANYNIIPLGLTDNGKSVYLRIPSDETGRFMGGILWKVLNRSRAGWVTNLLDYTAGQAPTINPGIEALVDAIQYAGGRNPYDAFKGRYAIPERIQEAGGKRRHMAFAKYLAQKAGAGIVYKFKYDDVGQITTELEKVLGYPFASNILGRFIKVTDYGKREDIREEVKLERQFNAREILDAKDAIRKIVRGETLDEADIEALLKKPDILEHNLIVGLARKHGNLLLDEFLRARTIKEKQAMIRRYVELSQGKK